MNRFRFVSWISSIALLGTGCSVITDPDPSLLGGGDAATRQPDGGPGQPDGGPGCSCDDGIACTEDRCGEGTCVSTPNDALCTGDERCSASLGCVPAVCETAAQCDDGIGCTLDGCDPSVAGDPSGCLHVADDTVCATGFCMVGGACDPSGGCVGGTARDCSDSDPCTVDRCDEAASACVNTPRDDDMDGHGPSSVIGPDGATVACGGGDCDDSDPARHPGATEACNGIDDNCDGRIDEGCSGGLPDTCASAEAIALDSSGRGSVSGSFGALVDDYQTGAPCEARTGGRDAVYYIDLPAGRHDVVIDTIGSATDTVLAVGFDCTQRGFQTACNDDYGDPDTSRESRIWLHNVGSLGSSTRVYILVDAYDSSTAGSYVLNVNRNNAGSDSCPSGLGGALPLEISGGGTVVGVLSGVAGSQRGSCQSATDFSPEAIFRVRGPSAGVMDFTVYSRTFSPDAYLREAPCGSGRELECDQGSSIAGSLGQADIRQSVTSGDLHYLFVEGDRGGTYALYYQPY